MHSGQEEYERLRPMSYSQSHVILIAFAIDTPDSLDNVTVKVRSVPRSFLRAYVLTAHTVDRRGALDLRA